jgi:8-oxo-dGTP pyrophosphatase MutT (NUDIX family)
LADDLFARLSNRLVQEEPTHGSLRTAAVSMVLHMKMNPLVLLMRRAENPRDPWSGQISFPGGKMQPGDRSVKDTAARETLEEVGIDLLANAEFLGYAEATTTHTGTMQVVPCVFLLRREVEVIPNGEVASYRWVDLGRLLSGEARSTFQLQTGERALEMPAFTVGDYIVWGLTHRILSSMLL